MSRSLPSRPPNVVVLVSHDTGRHLSPYGVGSVQTPNFERLAKESVLFSNCFCTSPLCSPARSALFTGRYPHQNGVQGLVDSRFGWSLKSEERHAAHLFGAAGYETMLCQGCHEVLDHRTAGFQDALWGPRKNGPTSRRDSSILFAPELIDAWLDRRDATKPFYLQIGCHETHRGFVRDEGLNGSANGHDVVVPPYLQDTGEIRQDLAEFHSAVADLDRGVGGILDLLDRRGLAEDTIFVATTDHGIDFPRAKGCFYDPGIEVFLLMRYSKGGWKAGTIRNELLSQIDVLPTLLEACDIPVPDNMAGRSFLSLLDGSDPYQPREAIFAEKTFHDSYDPTRVIRTDRWKYIRYFDATILHDIRHASVTRAHYRKHSIVRDGFEELYDLAADPAEENNLATDPEFQSVREDLRKSLRDWMQETADPLLEGPIRSPVYEAAIADLLRA